MESLKYAFHLKIAEWHRQRMSYVEIPILFPKASGYYFPKACKSSLCMTCLECQKELSYLDHRASIEQFKVELCANHRKRLEKLQRSSQIPVEAIMLYYGLKEAGVKPMIAWWNGKRMVDLAISRVKLNIEIDKGYESLSHRQAMEDLEGAMHSFRDGFTTIRIPHFLIRDHLRETVSNIMGIMEGLRANIRAV